MVIITLEMLGDVSFKNWPEQTIETMAMAHNFWEAGKQEMNSVSLVEKFWSQDPLGFVLWVLLAMW